MIYWPLPTRREVGLVKEVGIHFWSMPVTALLGVGSGPKLLQQKLEG